MLDKIIKDISEVIDYEYNYDQKEVMIRQILDNYSPLRPGDLVKVTDSDGVVEYYRVILHNKEYFFMARDEFVTLPHEAYKPTSIAELNIKHHEMFELAN